MKRDTDALDVCAYTSLLEVRMLGAGLVLDKEGYWALQATLLANYANMLMDSCVVEEPKTWKELEECIHRLWPIANSTHEVRLHLNEYRLTTSQHFSVYMTEFEHLRKFAEIDEFSWDAWHYFMQGLPPLLQILTHSFVMCEKLKAGTSSVKELYAYVNGAGSDFAMLQKQLQLGRSMPVRLSTTPNFNRSLQFSELLNHDKPAQQVMENRSQVRRQGYGQLSGTSTGQSQPPRGNQSYYRPAHQEGQCPFQRSDQTRGGRPVINQVETSEDSPMAEEAITDAHGETSEDLDDIVWAREVVVLDDWVPEWDEDETEFEPTVSVIRVLEAADRTSGSDEESTPVLCQTTVTLSELVVSTTSEDRITHMGWDGRWVIPATVHVGERSHKVSVLLDSGATHSIISSNLASELGCEIMERQGTIATAQVGAEVGRIGSTMIRVTTSRHDIQLEAEVFPGETNLPVFFGVKVINKYGPSSLLVVLADCKDHPIAASATPDIEEQPVGDDSAFREEMLNKLRSCLRDNAVMDLAKPCPLPEAIVWILVNDDSCVYHHQP
ncbi:hypothetical protein GGI09_001757 [Coemansia sp. S100]|nr:hypothetical protein GGI09_001757 [Coemansia sp. S100]